MYELVKVGEHTYYIDCPSRMGVYVRENEDAYLIDSGNDKDAGKKVKRIIEGEGWTLKGVLVTHAHADHIGGCNYLQNQTGCKIFAGGLERAFAEHPVLMPVSLYGGDPHKEIRHKDMIAKPCKVSGFDDENFPKEIEIINLSGHAPDQTGYKTPDGIVFLADVLCTKQTLDKYGIVYLYDIAAHIDSLDRLEHLEASVFVPAHCPVSEDIAQLVQYNKEKVLAAGDVILNICSQARTWEDILAEVFHHYGLKMSYAQHELVGSTVRSYLTYLEAQGRVQMVLDGSYLKYQQQN